MRQAFLRSGYYQNLRADSLKSASSMQGAKCTWFQPFSRWFCFHCKIVPAETAAALKLLRYAPGFPQVRMFSKPACRFVEVSLKHSRSKMHLVKDVFKVVLVSLQNNTSRNGCCGKAASICARLSSGQDVFKTFVPIR